DITSGGSGQRGVARERWRSRAVCLPRDRALLRTCRDAGDGCESEQSEYRAQMHDEMLPGIELWVLRVVGASIAIVATHPAESGGRRRALPRCLHPSTDPDPGAGASTVARGPSARE